MSVTVPFTLRSIHPDITAVALACHAGLAGQATFLPTTPVGIPVEVPVSQLTKAADGSYSGTSTYSFSVTVPADIGGKAGRYVCTLWGKNPQGGTSEFNVAHPDLRYKVNPPDRVEGQFTW